MSKKLTVLAAVFFTGYSCVEAYDIHWANGASQFGNFVLECVPTA